jgi:hypothetical protein
MKIGAVTGKLEITRNTRINSSSVQRKRCSMATTGDSTLTGENSASGALPLLYEQSSQFRHWRFSNAQLHDIRDIANAAAVERVKTNYEQELVGSQ